VEGVSLSSKSRFPQYIAQVGSEEDVHSIVLKTQNLPSTKRCVGRQHRQCGVSCTVGGAIALLFPRFLSRCLVSLVLLLGIDHLAAAADSLDRLSTAYSHLKYNNLNGSVWWDGSIRRRPFPGQARAYNAIGCSGFVVPVLNKYIYGSGWKNYQRSNWRLYEKYGSEIAEAYQLPIATELSSNQVHDPAQIRGLIEGGALKKGGKYLFDTRLGILGHTGFIEVNANGTLTTHMFSGIGKGKDLSDDTCNPKRFPARELARRSKRSGYTTGEFSAWYNGSWYLQSPVKLFTLPEGYVIKVVYGWLSQQDLDTGTTFAGNTVGYSYPDNTNNEFLTWSMGNYNVFQEVVEINLQKALEEKVVKRSEPIVVNLAAGWFGTQAGFGATVTTMLYLNDGLVWGKSKVILPGVQMGPATTSVGTLTLNLSTGAFTLE
jgi:hypothetical protein